MFWKMIAAAVLPLSIFPQDLAFVQAPQMTKVNDTCWQIEFTLNRAADVAVSIVNPADSTVACHVAGGVLGPNPPAPLIKDSLHQVLAWDGRDDFQRRVPAPDALRLRVRAGMAVTWANAAEGDYYRFNSLEGLATDTSGNLFVYGMVTALGSRHIRMYGPDGGYLRTIYPYPPGLSPEESDDYGINKWQGSVRYSPKFLFMRRPRFSPIIISQDVSFNYVAHKASYLGQDVVNEKLYVISTDMLDCMALKPNGGLSGVDNPVRLVLTPAAGPTADQFKGALFLRFSRNGATAYLSGFYAQNGPLFWMTSRVYAVDVLTGAARILIEKSGALFNGIALDDSGRVFVCESNANQVAVYDTAGALLGAVPVPFPPNQVEINRATGEIYVVTKSTVAVSAYKFAPFGSGNTAPLAQKINLVSNNLNADRIYVALGKSDGKAVLWVGNHASGNAFNAAQGDDWDQRPEYSVWGLRDDGNGFTIIRDFGAGNRVACTGFDRIAVDRKTETVFIQNGWDMIYKIEDWRNPKVEVCSTAAGRLLGLDMTVGPNGLLYVREQTYNWEGDFKLYTMDHRHRLIRTLIPDNPASDFSRWGAGYGERGIGVRYDGNFAVMGMEAWCDYYVGLHDSMGTQVKHDLVNPIFGECGGVRFDKQNNVYVGGYYRGAGHRYPRYTAADVSYLYYTGSVIKFPPEGGATDNTGGESGLPVNLRKVYGALTVYPDGLAPFSGTPGGDGCCTCRSPRFDVDAYGRLFMPGALACRVAVNDNNGNLITYFGEYGNPDCRGPGSAIPEPAVPLGFPVGAAATEDFVYVTDMYNNRVVQAKMNYALDNMPGLTDRGVGVADVAAMKKDSPHSLAASPNPFNPLSRITVSMASRGQARLSVYDVRGRLVRSLVSRVLSEGSHPFTWDARDASGRRVPAGLYVYRLEAGARVFSLKTILAE